MQIKFSPIIPKPLNVAKLKHGLIEGMRDLGVEIRENFEDTTRTWNNKPQFDPPTSVPKVGVDFISVETTTEDQRYGWIDKGTRVGKDPYPIRAKNVKTLAFPSQFIPKTSQGIIGSGVGFIGPVDKFPVEVNHPGIEPRKFVETIKERQGKNARIILDRSMSLGVKASGHAYP